MSKKKVMVFIWLFEAVLLFMILRSFIVYKGIYQVAGLVVIPLIVSLITLRICTKENVKAFGLKIASLIVITLLVMVVLIAAKPRYTFEDGFDLINFGFPNITEEDYFGYEFGKNTAPLMYEELYFMVANRAYYYRFSVNDEYRYYLVDPTSGLVLIASEN